MSDATAVTAQTYVGRAIDVVKDPEIRSQLQRVWQSVEGRTLAAMVSARWRGESYDDAVKEGAAGTTPVLPADPSSEPTEDFAVLPTQVLDRSELEAATRSDSAIQSPKRSRRRRGRP